VAYDYDISGTVLTADALERPDCADTNIFQALTIHGTPERQVVRMVRGIVSHHVAHFLIGKTFQATEIAFMNSRQDLGTKADCLTDDLAGFTSAAEET
jgi:hypothetical protein